MAELIERLIAAGPAPDDAVAALVAELGLDKVAETLVGEILFRCPPSENTVPVAIALDVTHGAQRCRTVLRLARDEPIRETGSPDVQMVLEFTAADLVRRLFGPTGHRRAGDFRNAFLPSGVSQLDLMRPTSLATNTLLAGCGSHAVDLGSLAARYGSDKWASLHWYVPHYERHFARFRDQAVRVLEIGIGGEDHEPGGASLKMWKRYFHRGLVFGVDLFDKSVLDQPRLTTLVADQRVAGELTAIGERYGPFDVIIDDGSHVAEDIRTSFHALLPFLRDDGIYVIEDLQTSYLPEFGGATGEPHTAVGLVQQLVDGLHFREHGETVAPQPVQESITGLHVYHNLVFLEKGTNGEEGFPAWLRELLGDR
ncbi:class I SAM-dependent methyltransferase [Amycolatopsis acidicola]|uniref:Class I SAM-dependent methyltransferase n=1 Tax=Amycolatopsis acidicola TaxID=2596893 RepID=A0A5N0VMV9_9PSEU|nr:class I SAM-dependent methyltransferase [Amycolatopsis acidicola]KAA9166500.1 class I SAM-dependent methyltransferase [Amycolatopsis acidicola]